MRRLLSVVTIGVWLAGGAVGAVSGGEWGNLRGQFVYGGTPPTPPAVKITKDQECCEKHNVVDESLLVDAESKGVQNVVIYLYPETGGRAGDGDATALPIHERYRDTENAEIRIDNLHCRFDPHVVLLRTTQTLLAANSDPIGHNTKIDTFRNEPINDTIPSGGALKHKFENAERMPARVSCSIHPWMVGWVLVRDNPYMAVSAKDGTFEIQNLPVVKEGGLQFMFWHEKAGYVDEVTVAGQQQRWKRGRAVIEIKPGDNDLGVITLDPKLFEK